MNISDVKKQLRNCTLDSLYIFTGEEIEIQRIYINKIAETVNLSVQRADTIASIWGNITRPILFGEKHVYVVRDDKDILSNDILQSRLEKEDLNGNILICLFTTVDKRTKFYKRFNGSIVVFERLSTSVLLKYVQQDTKLNKCNSERIIAICENDYSRILLELDKLRGYKDWLVNTGYENETGNSLPACYDDSVFEYLVDQGVIYQPPKDAIFDLIDAILRRQVDLVYNLLEQCYAVGEANMVILSVLYNNAKQVLQVQSCESSDIVKSTGLTAWQVKCAKERCGFYRIGELVNMLRQIQRIQKDIITGQIDDAYSVEYLLVNVL